MKKMLETNPEQRLNIEELMDSNWICVNIFVYILNRKKLLISGFLKKYLEVPTTPLPTLDVFKEDENSLREINEEMGLALKEITIDDGQKVKLKTRPNNPMLMARANKAKAQNKESTLQETDSNKNSEPTKD